MMRRMLAAAMFVIAAVPDFSLAQQWPSQPLRLIVPFSAGGPTDVLGRTVAAQLSKSLGQPVVVENVLGAAGAIGLDRLAKSKPDGYTIGLSANTVQALAPHLSKLPYDTIKEFTPLGGLAGFPYGLVVATASPINTVDDLIARAKAAPGTVVAGSAGVGTGTQITIALLSQRAGLSFNEVNYKGSALVAQDIIGGRVDFTFDVISNAVPMVKQGLVKVIATSGARRHRVLTVPTVGETVPGFEFTAWYGIFGPAGMPAEVTRRLSDELAAIHRTPEYRTFLDERGFDPLVASSDELSALLKSDYARFGEVVSRMPPAK